MSMQTKDAGPPVTPTGEALAAVVFTRGLTVRNVKAIDDGRRSVPVVASTTDVDGHGEVVDQNFILERFLANPVYIWNHNTWGQPDTEPLGHAENIRIEGTEDDPDGVLQMDLIHATEKINPRADRIFRSFKAQHQRAVSIGFDPKRVYWERVDGHDIAHLDENELFEISATPIGSNPRALSVCSMALRRAKLLQIARVSGDTIDPELEKRIDSAVRRSMLAIETRSSERPSRSTSQVPDDIKSEGHGRDFGSAQGQQDKPNPSGSPVEKDAKMDPKDIKIKELSDALAKANAAQIDANATKATLTAANKSATVELAGEREKSARLESELAAAKATTEQRKKLMDTSEARAVAAEEVSAKLFSESVDAELAALVGVKMMPDEVETMTATAKLSPELYSEQLARVKARKELPMLKANIMGDDRSAPETGGEGKAGAESPDKPRVKSMRELMNERSAPRA